MITILLQRILKYSAQAFNRHVGRWLPLGRKSYFAYGANINVELLNRKSIYPSSAVIGVLEDYEFAIESPCEMVGLGFASVRPRKGAMVYGLIIDVSSFEILILDLLEWVPFGLYGRYTCECSLPTGDKISAIIYRTKVPTPGLKASVRYRDTIVQGAKRQNFPPEYLHLLENIPVGTDFKIDHGFRLSNPTKRRIALGMLLPIYRIHDKMRERLCQLLP
jgi:hypothetical protein